MDAKKIETLTWVLIYGGLLLLSLGLFLPDHVAGLRRTFIVTGSAATAAGVVLVWVRSRMKP